MIFCCCIKDLMYVRHLKAHTRARYFYVSYSNPYVSVPAGYFAQCRRVVWSYPVNLCIWYMNNTIYSVCACACKVVVVYIHVNITRTRTINQTKYII